MPFVKRPFYNSGFKYRFAEGRKRDYCSFSIKPTATRVYVTLNKDNRHRILQPQVIYRHSVIIGYEIG